MGIDSELLDAAIRARLANDASARWLEGNKAAIDAYNAQVEADGLLL